MTSSRHTWTGCDASPSPVPSRRVHFHAFMQEIHEGMHEARAAGMQDVVAPVVRDACRLSRVRWARPVWHRGLSVSPPGR